MTRRITTVSGPLLGLLILVSVLPGTACEGFEPTRFPVGDTATLYSLARAEFIGRRSAFDFRAPSAVVVERPKDRGFMDFDMAFSELEDGTPVMLPAGLFARFEVNPGLQRMTGTTFEALEEAPTDGYIDDEPVPLEVGALYAVRTRESANCRQYAKFEVLDLDPDGIVDFRYLRNNLCNDRDISDEE